MDTAETISRVRRNAQARFPRTRRYTNLLKKHISDLSATSRSSRASPHRAKSSIAIILTRGLCHADL